MIIEFAGITFNDTGRGWVFADLIDWYTLPDSKAPNDPLPRGHGSFNPGTDWRAAAAISFTAAYIGDTHAECLAAVEEMTGAALNATTVRVTDALRTTYRKVSVRHIEVPDFFDYDTHEAHFAVDLLAWDPTRYSDPVTADTALPTSGGGLEYNLFAGGAGGALYYGALGNLGRVLLTNDGTAETWPVFEVTGLLDAGFVIQRLDSGMALRYDRVVPAGTTVTIDSRTGSVLIDGVSDGSTYLTRDEFFSVPPGGSCEVQFSAVSTGNGMLSVSFQSGWL